MLFTNLSNYLKSYKNFTLSDVFKGWSLLEKLWLLLAIFIISFSSYLSGSTFLIYIFSLLGVINLILVAKGKIVNYLFGIFYCFLYAVFSFKNQVYGQGILFLFFYFPMQFYGIYLWLKPENMQGQNQVKSRRLPRDRFLGILLIILVVAYLYGKFILEGVFDQHIAIISDSIVGVMSIFAFILMLRFYTEQWILWFMIDALTLYIWIDGVIISPDLGQNVIPLLIMRMVTIINAVYGYISWMRRKEVLLDG